MTAVLVLGGTGLARQLASALDTETNIAFLTSLAGRTRQPAAIAGRVRIGGFGGRAGLADFVTENRVSHLVVGTHAYANTITNTAWAVAKTNSLPICRLVAPSWPQPTAGAWNSVSTVAAAIKDLPAHARAFITTGHKELDQLITRPDCRFLVRLIEPPKTTVPENCQILLDQPPYTLSKERNLFVQHNFSHLITKNSGGNATRNKLVVAAENQVRIVMIERPVDPVRPVFHQPQEVIRWLLEHI